MRFKVREWGRWGCVAAGVNESIGYSTRGNGCGSRAAVSSALPISLFNISERLLVDVVPGHGVARRRMVVEFSSALERQININLKI
jgi:hypothetical protein